MDNVVIMGVFFYKLVFLGGVDLNVFNKNRD